MADEVEILGEIAFQDIGVVTAPFMALLEVEDLAILFASEPQHIAGFLRGDQEDAGGKMRMGGDVEIGVSPLTTMSDLAPEAVTCSILTQRECRPSSGGFPGQPG